MPKSKVFIVESGLSYFSMFRHAGWEHTSHMKEADLVLFTGGSDVSPELYGQAKHTTTHPNPARDFRERLIFNLCRKVNKPMVGICRGGQLLNVLCGGSLYQDVDGHYEKHDVHDISTSVDYPASSDHHQMMQVGSKGTLLAYASEAAFKEICWIAGKHKILKTDNVDPEVVHYPNEKVLCFQYHPEYPGFEYLADIFFGYLRTYLHVSHTKQEVQEVVKTELQKSLSILKQSLASQPNPSLLSATDRAELSNMEGAERQAKLADIQAAFDNATVEGVQVH